MVRVGGALADFELQLRADGRSEHTVRQYRRHVRLLATWMTQTARGKDLASLGHRDIAEFMTSEAALVRPNGAPKRPTSVNALRSSLRTFLAYCCDAGMLERNPARLLRRAKCGPPPPRAIADDDLRRMLDAMVSDGGECARRDHVMFTLIRDAAVRVGSVGALDVGDIDFGCGALDVRAAKGNQPYRVRLTTATLDLLRELVADRGEGPLFPAAHGGRMTVRQVQRRAAVWARRAGVSGRANVHSIRHRAALDRYEQGGDLLAVQRHLGHRSMAATAIYTVAV